MLNDVIRIKFSYVCFKVFTLWTIISICYDNLKQLNIYIFYLHFTANLYTALTFAWWYTRRLFLVTRVLFLVTQMRDDGSLTEYRNFRKWFVRFLSLYLQKFPSWCESMDVFVLVSLNFHTLTQLVIFYWKPGLKRGNKSKKHIMKYTLWND